MIRYDGPCNAFAVLTLFVAVAFVVVYQSRKICALHETLALDFEPRQSQDVLECFVESSEKDWVAGPLEYAHQFQVRLMIFFHRNNFESSIQILLY